MSMRTRWTHTLTAISLAGWLAGCQQAAPADSLFPLEGGHRWTYRVVTRSDDGTSDRETLTLRTLGADYWLRADASGIYRVASKSDLDAEPKLDQPQRFVLKAPYAVGTQWQAPTTAYLLMRRNGFPREIRHTHPSVPMTYEIEATNESVDTPAGRFGRCLRVKGTANVRLFADPATGWRDMPLTTREWYCAGVGLVRIERTEPARSAFLIGGTRTLELESWQ